MNGLARLHLRYKRFVAAHYHAIDRMAARADFPVRRIVYHLDRHGPDQIELKAASGLTVGRLAIHYVSEGDTFSFEAVS